MYILPNATDFNNACASVDRSISTKCEIYDDITETNVGEVATFETGVAKPLSTLKVGLTPKQDLNGYDHPWVGGAGKNKLDILSLTPTKNENGMTFTVNDDGSVTINGTATSQSQIYWQLEANVAQQYSGMILDCFETMPSGNSVFAVLEESGGSYTRYALNNTTSGATIASSIASITGKVNLIIRAVQGVSVTNAKVYPMIRPSGSTDGYAPYSNICPIYPSNGKNLLPLNNGTYTVGTNVTLTINDGVISFDGTASSSGGRLVALTDNFTLKAGTYYIKTNRTNAQSTPIMYLNKVADNTAINGGDNRSFTLTQDTLVFGGINLDSGVNYTGATARPMLNVGRVASPYVPYQGISVEHTGKNLIPSIFSDGKVPSISTGALVNANNACRSDYIKVESGSVTLSCDNVSNRQIYLFLYDSNMTFLTYQSTSGNFVTVTDANAQYAMVRCDGGTTSPSNIQLELGSSATSYEPYNGTTYPLPLGRDVYGGTVDLATGTLTVTKVIVDLGDLTWSYNSTNLVFSAPASGGLTNLGLNVMPDIICSNYPIITTRYGSNFPSAPDKSCTWSRDSSNVIVKDTSYTDKNTFKTAMSGVQVVYPLATPLVYNLTPTQINTLIGQNNIWVNDNTIAEITFYAPISTMTGDGINGEIISMEWDNIICSNDGLQIGTTCMDEFKMTYRPVSTTMSLMGKEIHPYVGLEFGSPATVTYVPLGVFWVTDASTEDDGYTVNITAYDGMQKLLGNFDATALGVTFPINAWALLTAIATHFGLTISYDKLTYELLTSDNYTLTVSNGDTLVVQQDINANQQAPLNKPLEGTYRDYVGWIVGLVGANAHMGRNGDLWVGRYEDHGFVIGRNVQHMGGAKINYGGSVTYECIVSGTDEEPLQPTGHSGNSITYTNPYITQEELDILNDALFADGNVVVTPCDVAWRSNPCVDAGDIVSVEDKDGNNSLTYVMERVVRITGGLAEDLHCYAETEVVHTLNKSPLVTKFAQLTNDIKEAVNPIDATKGTFEFIDNGDGTNGGFTIYENGTNSWLRCTAGGLGISADGGLTYTNAITKNGVTASRLKVAEGGITFFDAGVLSNTNPYIEFRNLNDIRALRIAYTEYYKQTTLSMTDAINGYTTSALSLTVGRTGVMPGDGNGGFSELQLLNPMPSGKGRASLMVRYSDDTSQYAFTDFFMTSGDPTKSYSRVGVWVHDAPDYGDSATMGIFDGSTGNELIGIRDDRGTPLMFVKSGNSYKSLTLRAISINGTTYYIMAST